MDDLDETETANLSETEWEKISSLWSDNKLEKSFILGSADSTHT